MQYEEAVLGIDVSDVTTRGVTSQFAFDVGGRVAGNLIVHGDLQFAYLYNADKEVNGRDDDFYRTDASMWLVGAGATYYFMPANVYLTYIAGVAGVTEGRDYDVAYSTGAGFGTSLLLGKEWWAGTDGEWGVGAALRGSFIFAPTEIARHSSTLRSQDLGVVFSATFN